MQNRAVQRSGAILGSASGLGSVRFDCLCRGQSLSLFDPQAGRPDRRNRIGIGHCVLVPAGSGGAGRAGVGDGHHLSFGPACRLAVYSVPLADWEGAPTFGVCIPMGAAHSALGHD